MHLVTGAAGYVGSNICNSLIKSGEKVLGIDLLERPSFLNKQVEYSKVDILDTEKIGKLMKSIDYVHHNAALVPLTKSGEKFREVNVNGTKNILKISIENKVKHFTHMSSSAVFGIATEFPITNFSTRNPVEIYGQSKKDAEDIVLGAINYSDTSISVIRPRTILGGDRLGIFELLFRWVSLDKPIFIIGKGNGLYQFAHINDIVNASIKSALSKTSGVFNVGATSFGTLYEDLNLFLKTVNSSSRVILLPEKLTIKSLSIMDKLGISPFAPWHYLTYSHPLYFDSDYVYKKLNYQPEGSNLDYLVESYKGFIKNKNKTKNTNLKSPHTKPIKEGLISIIADFANLIL